MKEITPEELAILNGKEGNSACVAVHGKVYDVSKSRLWPRGLHMNRHTSGKDLTAEISAAPHGTDVLQRFPETAVLVKAPPEELKHLPSFVRFALQSFPMIRRHPHPVLVHFPIAFSIGASLFLSLYLLSGNRNFEVTSFYLLILVGITCPFAIASGLLTWWINYGSRLSPLIKKKIWLSVLLVVLEIVLIIWRNSASGWDRVHPVYSVLMIALTPVVFLLGYFGGQMTFPLERD